MIPRDRQRAPSASQVTAQQFLGELDPLRMCRRRRHGARIDGKQVAPGRQHVLASTIWRAGRPRRNAPAGECIEQRAPLRLSASTAAEDMQSVAELAFLEVADEAIDLWNGVSRRA